MWAEIIAAKQENKRELTLNGQNFTEQLSQNNGKLDLSMFALQQVNFLQLSNSTQLCEIPLSIVNLENLQSLLLFGNHLSSLPGNFCNFY